MSGTKTQYRSWAKYIYIGGGGGGGGNLAERKLRVGGQGENTLESFEIFIPKIAANASNFKS